MIIIHVSLLKCINLYIYLDINFSTYLYVLLHNCKKYDLTVFIYYTVHISIYLSINISIHFSISDFFRNLILKIKQENLESDDKL